MSSPMPSSAATIFFDGLYFEQRAKHICCIDRKELFLSFMACVYQFNYSVRKQTKSLGAIPSTNTFETSWATGSIEQRTANHLGILPLLHGRNNRLCARQDTAFEQNIHVMRLVKSFDFFEILRHAVSHTNVSLHQQPAHCWWNRMKLRC